MIRTRLAALLPAVALPLAAQAPTAAPTYIEGNQIKTAQGTFILDKTGNPIGTTSNPLAITCVGATCTGGGGGSGGAVSLTGPLPGFASPPTVYDASTAAIAAAINAPLNAQTAPRVLIGAVEGPTAAGTPGANPVTVQPAATGFPVTASGAVTAAGNSTGAVNIVQPDSSVAINVATATTTQLVAPASGKSIYVTGWDIVVAAADTVTLEYGTGTNCATGTTPLTGAYNLAANGGLVAGTGLGLVFKVPAGNALCIVTSAATQASGRVTYAQF